MTVATEGEILARLDALKHDLQRLESNVSGLYGRLDTMTQQGHEVRIAAIEKRIDGMWGKIMAVVGAISAGITLVWNLMRGGAR